MARDIIGDVHGHADRLEALLKQLGYQQRGGAWRHPQNMAVFVGDFIDRGPHQLRTLELVRDMLDAESARAVMGNHELNAIGYATADPQRPGEFLRRRSEKNSRQHDAFLAEVGVDTALHRSWVTWMLELPLWLREPTFQVVHACWDPGAVAEAAPRLDRSRLRADHLTDAFARDHRMGEALDVLLKGPEAELPPGANFSDKEGHVRTAIRTRWWAPELATYDTAYIGPAGALIPSLPLPPTAVLPAPDRPTFIGHYWLESEGGPALLTDRVACVDYSVAKGGLMTAYRYDGEVTLTSEHFVAV